MISISILCDNICSLSKKKCITYAKKVLKCMKIKNAKYLYEI